MKLGLVLVLALGAELYLPDGGYQTGVTLLSDGGAPVDGAMVLDTGAGCTCSSGSSCKLDGGTAPLGVVMRGAKGTGCLPTPCVEVLGGADSPFNDSCPLPAPLESSPPPPPSSVKPIPVDAGMDGGA